MVRKHSWRLTALQWGTAKISGISLVWYIALSQKVLMGQEGRLSSYCLTSGTNKCWCLTVNCNSWLSDRLGDAMGGRLTMHLTVDFKSIVNYQSLMLTTWHLTGQGGGGKKSGRGSPWPTPLTLLAGRTLPSCRQDTPEARRAHGLFPQLARPGWFDQNKITVRLKIPPFKTFWDKTSSQNKSGDRSRW